MELLTVGSAALRPNNGDPNEYPERVAIVSDSRQSQAIAHTLGTKLCGASRSENVTRVAE
jgi:hypothetical protein